MSDTVLRFYVENQNVDRQNVERQNVKRQNVERQNVERQIVERQKVKKILKNLIHLTAPDSPPQGLGAPARVR
jgi:hypothetical protein